MAPALQLWSDCDCSDVLGLRLGVLNLGRTTIVGPVGKCMAYIAAGIAAAGIAAAGIAAAASGM